MLATEQALQESNTNVEPSAEKLRVKTERRDSTTSESSLEHLDLGHTPKKFKAHTATSTPQVEGTCLKNFNGTEHANDSNESQHVRLRESDEEAAEDTQNKAKISINGALTPRTQRHHKRRLNRTEKHASVQLEYNADNPNSLRKKFRFNRSTSENGNTITNNESGFVDASSQYLNTSGAQNSGSSGSSSPQGGSSSSPEGAGGNNAERDREEMKYLCPICEVVSATPHEFTNHIRCHNYASGDTENFTCRICSKVLSSASSLDRHVLVHTGERPFNCKYCHLTFTTNGNMHRHMRTHKQHQHNHQRRSSHGNKHNQNNNNNQTQQNNNHTTSSNNNNNTIITKTNPAANATITNVVNDQTHEIYESDEIDGDIISSKPRRNDETEDDDADGCSTDSSSAKSQSHNIKNIVKKLKRKNSNAEATNLLPIPEEDTMLKRCMKTINNNTIVPISENGFADLEVHPAQKVSFNELACPVCESASFNNLLSLSEHMDSAHAEIPAKCRRCEVVFRTHRQLNVHPCSGAIQLGIGDFAREKFPMMFREATNETEALQLKIRAYFNERPEINHASESLTKLQEVDQLNETEMQHKREEFLRQMFLKHKSTTPTAEMEQEKTATPVATTTPVKFESLESENTQALSISQQSQDSKDFADIQSILNMTSSSSTSNFLKNFEQSVNTPSSNYSYDKDEEEAQDVFTAEFRKMKLRGEFPCKLCTAVYPNLRALKGHNRVHLSSVGPAGPFRCNMCPYSICDKSALIRHMRTHNGDRPYECAACNYAFTTKANCERHLRNRHGKTTREEVKRSIIYHPSEDSSCDDPAKKLHLFNSPDLDDDFIDLPYTQQPQPKDRSTPVSHLKEMLTNGGYENTTVKAHKIQVKSLEKLIDKGSPYIPTNEVNTSAPIDLSMDVLDLSKKTTSVPEKRTEGLELNTNMSEEKTTTTVENNETEFPSAAENTEKINMLMAQQQLLMNEAFPKFVDPAQYIQHLYRQLMFQPLNPFFLQNPLFTGGLTEMNKLGPFMNRIFNVPESDNTGGNPATLPMPATLDMNKTTHLNKPSTHSPLMAQQLSPLLVDKANNNNIPNYNLQIPSAKPVTLQNELPRNVNLPAATVLPGGPVKMVIKNGVLMPKQKQRRYRTERPFACEHCSARFTLRSNMERHVKQQHPQYYAQRQRNGSHLMRGRGSNPALMPNMSHLQAAGSSSTISDQVKYAILAQQLKATRRESSEILQQALAHGSGSILAPNQMLFGANATPGLEAFNFNQSNAPTTSNVAFEDDDPKLVIDEDENEDEENDNEENVEDEDEKFATNENLEVQKQLEKTETENENKEPLAEAKKVAETILEQAIKDGQMSTKVEPLLPPPLAIPLLPAPPPPPPPPPPSSLKSMIAHAESVGKFLKEVASSPFKDESQDLVPVSKLVDNATTNAVTFNNIFRPSDVANHMEQSDEEGLVASGSASESNNSGTEDVVAPVEPKKKSAYSLAPNRVSCPYCQRMFPWSSSLRRHILTHTGQKPFKCSHCPLLFTTKSNCDRHLLRKHGNVESAVSVYVPTEDVTEPIPVPKSVEEIEQQQRRREKEEKRRKLEEAAAKERVQLELMERQMKEQKQQENEQKQILKQFSAVITSMNNNNNNNNNNIIINSKLETNVISSTELPFKCHLCESSFGERLQCLEHIKNLHTQDFDLLIAKGAVDTEHNQLAIDEEERRTVDEAGRNLSNGKYPDYSNRKVICAFCVRRFWSTEDLRRHMRTHSGERPFQCEICLRKFTLKHSMLRHMKKHTGRTYSGNPTNGDVASAGNSGSDFSDDEQATSMVNNNTNSTLTRFKIQDLLEKANEWRSSRLTSEIGDHKENIAEESNNPQSDLIGNLLGISDQGILNKLLSSPDEAAKLLGVEK